MVRVTTHIRIQCENLSTGESTAILLTTEGDAVDAIHPHVPPAGIIHHYHIRVVAETVNSNGTHTAEFPMNEVSGASDEEDVPMGAGISYRDGDVVEYCQETMYQVRHTQRRCLREALRLLADAVDASLKG